jgi:hypothetical protein
MFEFSEKTVENKEFKLKQLFSMIGANKDIKKDAENISSIQLSHILSPETTMLEPSEIVSQIYVIDIELKNKNVSELFVGAFDKFIEFQTLFRVHYNDEIKYIISIKTFFDGKMKIIKTFESDWKSEEKFNFPQTSYLENVFKSMIQYVSGTNFKPNETFEDYLDRLDAIKKLKAEIEKRTRMMNAEKQPNIKMELNDKIKVLKKELQEMEK